MIDTIPDPGPTQYPAEESGLRAVCATISALRSGLGDRAGDALRLAAGAWVGAVAGAYPGERVDATQDYLGRVIYYGLECGVIHPTTAGLLDAAAADWAAD